MAPATWQVGSPWISVRLEPIWVETIGQQGTFVALGYSQSRDLAGVTLNTTSGLTRIGFVPLDRLIATAGEWILEGGELRSNIHMTGTILFRKAVREGRVTRFDNHATTGSL